MPRLFYFGTGTFLDKMASKFGIIFSLYSKPKSQKFNRPPIKQSTKNAYISPTDFNARNSKLMGTISIAFGGAKSLEFNTFKSLSNQLRSGKMSAVKYLDECNNLLDSSKKFDDFIPEMIALLPNISKQTVNN